MKKMSDKNEMEYGRVLQDTALKHRKWKWKQRHLCFGLTGGTVLERGREERVSEAVKEREPV